MGGWFSVIILISCGALIAVQGTMNAALGRSLGLPLFVVVFSALQLACSIPLLVLLGWPPRWTSLAQTPPWQHIGASLGVLILWGMAYGLTRVGTYAGLVALLVGQLVMGLYIDRFGLFDAPVHPITLSRILGLMLVMGGAWLTKQ